VATFRLLNAQRAAFCIRNPRRKIAEVPQFPRKPEMKSFLSQVLLVTLAATAASFGQTEAKTIPVGYVSHTLKAGVYNLIGLTVHEPNLTNGAFESKNSASLTLTDNEGLFSSFVAGQTYLLEISSGTSAGAIQEVTTWSGNTLTNLPADFLAGLTGAESYSIRKSSTLGSIFGEQNQAALLGGNANSADLIMLPNGSGGFNSFYYSTGGFTGTGWRKVGGGSTDFVNQPVVYTDGLLILRRGATDLTLTISGSVKNSSALVGVANQYEYLGGVYPVGSTLASSGLSSKVLAGNANTADLIMMPNGSGGYLSYYYSSGGFTGVGWRQVGGGATDKAATELPSGFILCRRQGAFNLNLTPPASYANF
jgi:uncharacterized protein (TIGR02597 family)